MEREWRTDAGHEGFERLIADQADRVYRVALRITGSPTDAEDVMQETFLRAFEHWSEFRGEAAASTWLYRIAINTALSLVRRRVPQEYLEDTGFDRETVRDWSADEMRALLGAELRDLLQQGISQLPPDYRAALVLRDVEGLSTAEAAAVLDISEANLKSRLHRARALLRQFLSDYLDERQGR